MEGLNPNIFLAKKLKTEGLLDEEEELKILKPKNKSIPKPTKNGTSNENSEATKINEAKKRLSDTSDDSGTQVIIKTEDMSDENDKDLGKIEPNIAESVESAEGRKRKASPIVFNVNVKKERTRERTTSTNSDNHIIITSNQTHKYDTVPSCKYYIYYIYWI